MENYFLAKQKLFSSLNSGTFAVINIDDKYAKRLMDSGVHPPTIYFPLIVHEAMMIEPTETECKEVLDDFISTMVKIAKEVDENPDIILKAPNDTPIKKVDETLAARKPDLKFENDRLLAT